MPCLATFCTILRNWVGIGTYRTFVGKFNVHSFITQVYCRENASFSFFLFIRFVFYAEEIHTNDLKRNTKVPLRRRKYYP